MDIRTRAQRKGAALAACAALLAPLSCEPASALTFGSGSGPAATVIHAGVLRVGNRPAPGGVTIELFAAKGAQLILCGSAVTDVLGRYALGVVPSDSCIAPTHAERPTHHLFVVAGATAGHVASGASLDQPRSMRHTRRDLRVPELPGFDYRTGASTVGPGGP
jgi:hypothetical protein